MYALGLDATHLIAAGEDRTVRVWDLRTQPLKLAREFEGHEAPVSLICVQCVFRRTLVCVSDVKSQRQSASNRGAVS